MPRTAIPIGDSPPWLAGVNLTAAVGDAANDHELDLGSAPVVLVAANYNAATVALTIELPASNLTFGSAQSIAWTLPAAVGGIAGVRATVITTPNVKQSDGKLYIDSADANFGDVRLYAFTWAATTP